MNLLPSFVGAPELNRVYHCDALTLLRAMPDASVDLITTDPPFNIGKADWDSWSSLDSYLAWLDEHLREFRRVLKPNGSLYLFCATLYQAEVHLAVKKHFNVLGNIRWRKEDGWHKKADEEMARSYFHASETVIFAEHYNSDNFARGESSYIGALDDLRGFLFEPLRSYLDSERRRAGVSFEAVREMVGCASGSGLPSHWFTPSQWILPTAEQYAKLYNGFNRQGGDYLKREYEDLKREYEDLRRPFYATADAPYTDVWDFATVNTYPGKHICEKPLDMCQHIVRMSSRPDALVLDPFCGSGNMLRAAWIEGRRYIGGDADIVWAERSRAGLRMPFERRQRAMTTQFSDLPLFAETVP